RRRELTSGRIQPNAAHLALAELEARWPEPFLLVTQNVDDLHGRAGSRNLRPMHGEMLKARCLFCGGVRPWPADLGRADRCPGCGRPGGLRPHVVWFGESPLYLDEIRQGLEKCRTFAAIGTSGDVYPAAGFVRLARAAGARTVELNLEPSRNAWLFDEGRYGPATEVVPAWAAEMTAGKS
ncbi:MAG: NAD-dependent protein deacylase, partial [Candidatus Adiutrix sp.]|nr:NAD-dependent protein deacylase [Candidatus Adiutrix sp.]